MGGKEKSRKTPMRKGIGVLAAIQAAVVPPLKRCKTTGPTYVQPANRSKKSKSDLGIPPPFPFDPLTDRELTWAGIDPSSMPKRHIYHSLPGVHPPRPTHFELTDDQRASYNANQFKAVQANFEALADMASTGAISVTLIVEAGMSEAGMSEAGMSEAGMSEAGMSEVGMSEFDMLRNEMIAKQLAFSQPKPGETIKIPCLGADDTVYMIEHTITKHYSGAHLPFYVLEPESNDLYNQPKPIIAIRGTHLGVKHSDNPDGLGVEGPGESVYADISDPKNIDSRPVAVAHNTYKQIFADLRSKFDGGIHVCGQSSGDRSFTQRCRAKTYITADNRLT